MYVQYTHITFYTLYSSLGIFLNISAYFSNYAHSSICLIHPPFSLHGQLGGVHQSLTSTMATCLRAHGSLAPQTSSPATQVMCWWELASSVASRTGPGMALPQAAVSASTRSYTACMYAFISG